MRPTYYESNPVPTELAELRSRVETLRCRGRGELLSLCETLAERAQREHRMVQAAEEVIAQLQLDLHCLRFDLDCTRGERDALREQLEQGF